VAYARDLFAASAISLGTLTAFVLLFQRFFKPLIALGDEWQSVQGALTGAERIFEVLAIPPEHVPSQRQTLPAAPGLRMTSVSFGYLRTAKSSVIFARRGGWRARRAWSDAPGRARRARFTLPPVFTLPGRAAYGVGGFDPRAVPVEDRRRVVAVVPQLVQLFSGTIAENLTLGDDTVPPQAIESACVLAGAADLIHSLPLQLQTVVRGLGGGGGVQLSGGAAPVSRVGTALLWEPRSSCSTRPPRRSTEASDAALPVGVADWRPGTRLRHP